MGKWTGNNKPSGTTLLGATDERIPYLDKGDRLEGTLELAGTFRIECEVKGTVRSKSLIVVGENARVQGEIEAAIVSIAGRIDGNVRGTKRVEIRPGGQVKGEVHTPCLVVEAGGILAGRSHMPVEGVQGEAARPLELVSHPTTSAS